MFYNNNNAETSNQLLSRYTGDLSKHPLDVMYLFIHALCYPPI